VFEINSCLSQYVPMHSARRKADNPISAFIMQHNGLSARALAAKYGVSRTYTGGHSDDSSSSSDDGNNGTGM
jgi:hypothetical protein